ncbi:APC family permease [Solirubrobacter ginsenosidimutans]|uniref:APC family permease n=1 Tax=Solirubrobacter ginsenosidimutans TaxID=490573 RepID=A0A9X3S4C1_9ACTN|nr:APC family permease [Solirubrobacter ginsenosidimutans]MDA0166545.1 APC family permease [Solirubrobacter ginsenosidimutans]
MSAAIMGPAVSTFFNPQFSTPFSGAATPFVYLVCLIAILIAASGIVEMARELPSAGAFYTYVTRGLGPRAGFVTGGLMFVAYALLPPAEVGLIGSYLQTTFRSEFGSNVPWWIIGLVPAGLMMLLAFEGIRSSLRAALVLFTLEVLVVVGLALIVVGHGGHDGLTLHPLTPSASPNGFDGLTTGFVFAALSFVGFEAAATLGDEVREPRRVVPRAVLISVLLVGLIYVFCIWAEVNGLGIEATNKLDGTSTPWNDLAATYASWMKWPVIIASVSSMFAVMLNSSNGIVRILNTMGREGLLPSPLAFIDPKRRTPSYAIFATGAFAIVLALGVGAVSGGLGDPVGGSNVYGYLGFLLTLGILPVYVLTNLAAARYFASSGRFKLIRHGVLPLGGASLMVALLVGQILEQTVRPYTWFPWLIVIWIVLAAAGAQWLASKRPKQLELAGAVLASADAEQARETVGVG